MSKNEDVIELGSSDEEAKPTPKKRKLPDAMVVIPGQRPLKFVRSNSTIIQKAVNPANTAPLLKKPITFRNINNNCNAPILKKMISTPTPGPVIQSFQNNIKIPVAPQMLALNPLGYIKSLTKQVTVKKMSSNKKPKSSTNILQGSKLLTNLPPGLTIKPVSQPSVSSKKREINIYRPKKYESSVEIDEEESFQSSSGSPNWYLRPEDQGYNMQPSYVDTDVLMGSNTDFSMEEHNNMEPDALKYVEIVIEDSPVKHDNETRKEFAITIEDSPVKPITRKAKYIESNSDKLDKTPLSKKKLQYPKDTNVEKQVVEIEIDICESNFNCNDSKEPICQNLNDQESEKSEKKKDESLMKDISEGIAQKESNEEQKKVCDEFHPEYQKFIDLCFELENSSDMNKIVDKKIKAYYKQCPKEYIESEEFIEMVSSKVTLIKASPEKMYLYIKDIVDELNLQRKMNKIFVAKKNLDKATNNEEDIDEFSYDYKRQRQIRKLEKTVKKLHRAIQKLEEQEVDFEDDEDSVYLLTERYKERLVKVYEKLCQVTNTKMPSEPRIHLEARSGQPSGPARNLEAWINKKVPIGTPLPFPDFHDVVQCVRDANKDDRLGWSEMEIMDEARDLFTRCGRKLQRRRQENEWRIASSRVAHHADPAEDSADLRNMFEENKKSAISKETELLNKYVEKQNQMKLEAVEIGEKEAEESPIESGEDDDVTEESSSLDDKQKRKYTIKKLIEEKTKKNEVKKNNSQDMEDTQNKDETKERDTKIDESNTKPDNNESENMEVQSSIKSVEENHEKKEIEPDKDDNMRDSDDGTIASGVDELNLLEKLYSENEINSSQESSDSDASVMTLDTIELDSDTENSRLQSIDVISIENSSYSENESSVDCHDQNSIKNSTEKTNKEIVENILLALSDDETSCAVENIGDCINLRDDNISITESTLDGENIEKRNIDSVLENNAIQISVTNVNNDSDNANCDENIADSRTCLDDSGVNNEVQNIPDACGSGVENIDSQIYKEKIKADCIDNVISNEGSVNKEHNVKENESNNQNTTVSC